MGSWLGATNRSITLQVPVTDPYAIRGPVGGDLYLDTTAGVDGTGTFASPWNNLTTARLQSVVAGQALWVRAGSNFVLPDCRTLQTGTALNPIIFSCYPTGGNWNAGTWETATITMPTGGVICGGGPYWRIKGFHLTCIDKGWVLGNNSGSGAVAPCFNWQFIDCIGLQTTSASYDNCGIIVADAGSAPEVDYLDIIRGSYVGTPFLSGTTPYNNQALLFIDYVHHFTIQGALVDGSALPIYFKHTNITTSDSSPLVKNCIIRRAGRDFEAQMNWVTYQNNVFDSCTLGLDASGGALGGGNNCTLTHNTFLNSNVTMYITDTGTRTHLNNTFLNNVFAGSSNYADNPYGANGPLNQNNSVDYSAATTAANYYRNNTHYTLSAYAAAYPANESNGVAGTISFVGGAGGGGTTAAAWALAPGTIGTAASGQAASDGGDRGVNAAKLLTVN